MFFSCKLMANLRTKNDKKVIFISKNVIHLQNKGIHSAFCLFLRKVGSGGLEPPALYTEFRLRLKLFSMSYSMEYGFLYSRESYPNYYTCYFCNHSLKVLNYYHCRQ